MRNILVCIFALMAVASTRDLDLALAKAVASNGGALDLSPVAEILYDIEDFVYSFFDGTNDVEPYKDQYQILLIAIELVPLVVESVVDIVQCIIDGRYQDIITDISNLAIVGLLVPQIYNEVINICVRFYERLAAFNLTKALANIASNPLTVGFSLLSFIIRIPVGKAAKAGLDLGDLHETIVPFYY